MVTAQLDQLQNWRN